MDDGREIADLSAQVEHPTASTKSVNNVKRADKRTLNYANVDSK